MASISRPPVATEDQHKNADISIWWDMENCQIPSHKNAKMNQIMGCSKYNPQWIINNFLRALREENYLGKVSIFAFGDLSQINYKVKRELECSGFTIYDIPEQQGAKDTADKKMIIQIFSWARKNPPPANILLISGDTDFWPTLKELKKENYNVMLAVQNPKYIVNPPTEIIWRWTSLLSGKQPELFQ